MILLVVVAAIAAQTGVEDEALGMSLLTRPEPSLAAGVDAMTEGDVDRAIERFRSAQPRTPEEQAAVEYDVGQALLQKALAGKKQAAEEAKQEGLPDDVKKSFEGARESFDKAYGQAQRPRTKSEAALAAGNALAESGDVKGAIDAYRRAVVANPANQPARENLLRALRYLKAQPPPPPQEGKNDDEKKDDEKKDGEKKDGEKKDGDGEKKDGEGDPQNGGGEPPPKDDEQKPPEPKDGAGKPQPQGDDDKKPPEPKDGAPKEPDLAQPPGQPAPGTPPPTSKKRADAKRILDALRSRERPLQPLLMRVPPGKLVAPEKDW